MEDKDLSEGRPEELHGKLESQAEVLKVNPKAREWPKAPNALTNHLNEIKPNLQDVGILVTTGGRFTKDGKRSRKVTIEKIGENPVPVAN